MAKGRILAIDDEKFFRELYRDILAREGYVVRTAGSGEEALDILRREDFDLVISDLGLTGMDGVETSRAIKRFNPEQEIIVVSALADVPTAVAAMKAGVTDYVCKPINPDEFLLLVNKTLFRRAQHLEHRKLLSENLEYVSIVATYQKCRAFLHVHDLDRLGDLILDTLMELLRAEGGALWLAGFDGSYFRRRCRRGLARVLPEEETLHLGDDQHPLPEGDEPVLLKGDDRLWVPLRHERETLALMRIEAPVGRAVFNRGDLKIAAAAAEFAASALHNVLRQRVLEQASLRMPRAEAYTMAFFRDHMDKELSKARRYGRNLALIRLRVENYTELHHHFRSRELDAAMSAVIEAINSILRDADIMAMAAADDFYILLPETDYWGSLITQKRIRKALRGKLMLSDLKKTFPIRAHMRSAAFPLDGTSFEQLNGHAEDRLTRLQSSLYLKESWDNTSFWGVVGKILGKTEDYHFSRDGLEVAPGLHAFGEPLKSCYVRMPEDNIDLIHRAFLREVVESIRVRGVIFRGCADFDQVHAALPNLDQVEKSATSLFLLGGGGRVHWDYQRTVPIFIAEEPFGKVPFLLYLNEDSAYALFVRRRGRELVGFHTCDFYFVENMIAKLQEQYQLQVQI
ncbi:response regulator [Geoalkalibacter halelectricus]|uniref:Response regulator n=1 Tax=Geoalkalibacter halelectricus TaxID=2847045 RepID=A0ABY5ZGA8_9BACT|nr:response regulator [Geoalkalibacter halelectricus]MDO3379519.1 response regulator [Geoalkalibacter halelectricus]UWZ78108.1 response regulator [Geoalkalibacter halelectricus]